MTFLWLIFVISMFISFSCNYDGIFIRRWLFASMIFMTCTNLRDKSTQFLSYKHQNHQKIIQYSDNLTITHTIPHYFGCKVTSNPPNRTIWFVDDPLWFVNAAFCTSQHTTTVKNTRQIITFCIKLAAALQNKQVNLLFCTHLTHLFRKIVAQSK